MVTCLFRQGVQELSVDANRVDWSGRDNPLELEVRTL